MGSKLIFAYFCSETKVGPAERNSVTTRKCHQCECTPIQTLLHQKRSACKQQTDLVFWDKIYFFSSPVAAAVR